MRPCAVLSPASPEAHDHIRSIATKPEMYWGSTMLSRKHQECPQHRTELTIIPPQVVFSLPLRPDARKGPLLQKERHF